MRVLHGPVNVGNQPWVLSRAERRLGLLSDVVINYNTWLGYNADKVLGDYGKLTPGAFARRVAFAAKAPFKYDVLHFYFGRSYLFFEDAGGRLSLLAPLLAADLRLARKLGKRVFMTLQGCDARIASSSNTRNEWTMCAEGRCSVYAQCVSTYDARRKKMIDTLLPLCDQVFFLNPELGHELPASASFLPYASCDIQQFGFELPKTTGRARIVHAPSNGGIKGTPLILQALDALKAKYDFELVLVENKPHKEALELYRSADIAIDQIFAGWYGGYAVEMMAMGKPVACSIRDRDLDFVPTAMRDDLPLLRISPDTLAADIERILQSRADWPEWGAKSRKFVEKWHDPDVIARAVAATYRDPKQRLAF